MIRKILKGTKIELTESINLSVDKIVLVLDKYVDPSDTSALIEVEVGRTTVHHHAGDIFRAEINFHSRMGSFRVESEKEELHGALLATRDELLEILRSRKAKRNNFVRKSGLALKKMLRGLPFT